MWRMSRGQSTAKRPAVQCRDGISAPGAGPPHPWGPGGWGFGEAAVKSSVPGWVILMRRFEANRRYRELQTIAERDRQLRDERFERLRREFEREGPLTPDELKGIKPRPVVGRPGSRQPRR